MSHSGGTRRWVRLLGGVALISLAVEAAVALPARQWLADVVAWLHGAGAWGALAYAGVYISVTALLLPGSILTAGAGFAYGPLYGTLLVSPVSVVAASVAFILGRTLFREWVAGRAAADPRLRAVDTAIRTQGFRIVLLLRLSPLFPFSVLNYALGLTSVGLRDYVLASFIGMLPATFLYVYLGSLARSVADLSQTSADGATARIVLSAMGLLATAAVTIVITRMARRALNAELGRAAADTQGA